MSTHTETTHTPGPWTVFIIASPDGTSFRIHAGDTDIAHIPMAWNGEANAALIAAAPETARQRDALLAALAEMLGCFTRERFTPTQIAAVANARAAIADARGTQGAGDAVNYTCESCGASIGGTGTHRPDCPREAG